MPQEALTCLWLLIGSDMGLPGFWIFLDDSTWSLTGQWPLIEDVSRHLLGYELYETTEQVFVDGAIVGKGKESQNCPLVGLQSTAIRLQPDPKSR